MLSAWSMKAKLKGTLDPAAPAVVFSFFRPVRLPSEHDGLQNTVPVDKGGRESFADCQMHHPCTSKGWKIAVPRPLSWVEVPELRNAARARTRSEDERNEKAIEGLVAALPSG